MRRSRSTASSRSRTGAMCSEGLEACPARYIRRRPSASLLEAPCPLRAPGAVASARTDRSMGHHVRDRLRGVRRRGLEHGQRGRARLGGPDLESRGRLGRWCGRRSQRCHGNRRGRTQQRCQLVGSRLLAPLGREVRVREVVAGEGEFANRGLNLPRPVLEGVTLSLRPERPTSDLGVRGLAGNGWRIFTAA